MSKNNKMTWKEITLCIFLIVVLIAISAYMIYSTWPNSLPESRSNCDESGNMFGITSFELVNKAIHPNSSEIIEITTCWMIDTPILQVGKLVTIDASVNSLRYVENVTNYEKIVIEFPHDLTNYWYDVDDARQINFSQSNYLVLYQDDSKIFRSENPINIRFSVSENIFFKYCEHANNINCFEVNNIIQPAPHYVESNYILIDLTRSLLTYTIIIIFITLLIPVIITIYSKHNIHNTIKYVVIGLFVITCISYINYIPYKIFDESLITIISTHINI